MEVLDDPKTIEEITEFLDKKKDCVIAHTFLCEQKARKLIEELATDFKIIWICFENDPDLCIKNVARRNTRGDCRKVLNSIRVFSHRYTFPKNAKIIPVWRRKNETWT